MSPSHAEQMNRYYTQKWQGHNGYWLDYYQAVSKVYASSLNVRRNHVIAAEVPRNVQKVLDVGCGIGDLMVVLSKKSKLVVGIDIAEVNVRLCRKNLVDDEIANTEVLQAAAEDLPFCTGTFDLVLLADVIEHVRNVDTVLREVSRVLKPGATFICVTPYPRIQRILSHLDFIGRCLLRLRKKLRGSQASEPEIKVYEKFLSPQGMRDVLNRNTLFPSKYRRICFYPGNEGAVSFNILMTILYKSVGVRKFEIFARIISQVFDIIERLQILNQKQIWVAKNKYLTAIS